MSLRRQLFPLAVLLGGLSAAGSALAQGAGTGGTDGYALAPAQATIERDAAVLRWLDKVTGRVETLVVPVNQTVRVQALEVIVRTCRERPPEEPPESAAFLDVWDIRPGEAAADVFRGWMFASSPALSAMEHPVYDLWVLDCLDQRDDRANDSTSSTAKDE